MHENMMKDESEKREVCHHDEAVQYIVVKFRINAFKNRHHSNANFRDVLSKTFLSYLDI